MDYEDFVLQIGPDLGEGYTVSVVKSPAGEGFGHLALPFDSEDLESFWGQIEETARQGSDPNGSSPRDLVTGELVRVESSPSPEVVGTRLFQALFTGEIRRLYDQSLGRVELQGERGLRIQLKMNPRHPKLARLASLPWEYLYRPETEEFLNLSRWSPIVRYLDLPRPHRPLELDLPLRILVVVASPRGLEPLNLYKERSNLEKAWGKLRQSVELLFAESPTVEAVRRIMLREQFHVLHFMGHGGFDEKSGEGLLYFEDAAGKIDPVEGRSLAAELRDFKSVRLVFLNACQTARSDGLAGANPYDGVATALMLGGMSAVVAMQAPISDRAAIVFSRDFYRRLATGDPVDAAVVEGRMAIHRRDVQSREWGTPVLFTRVPSGRLFVARKAKPATRAPRKRRGALRWGHGRWAASTVVVSVLGVLALGEMVPETWSLWGRPEGLSEGIGGVGTTDLAPEAASHPGESIETVETPAHRRRIVPLDLSRPLPEDWPRVAMAGALESAPPRPIRSRASEGQKRMAPPPPPPAPPPARRVPPPPSSGSAREMGLDGMVFRYVRGGRFTMGRSVGREPDEQPHEVEITRDFWIGETEVTQGQWLEVEGSNPANFQEGYPEEMPVERVNWYDSLLFANALSERVGLESCYVLGRCTDRGYQGVVCRDVRFKGLGCAGFRLPTEAEWEMAARAGTSTAFSTGVTLATSQANFQLDVGRPVVVRRMGSRNPWGLFEVHGNVNEWVWDFAAPFTASPSRDPLGPSSGEGRMVRGGGYRSKLEHCRSGARRFADPSQRYPEVGLRLARTAQPGGGR